jgi:hypothetical protein
MDEFGASRSQASPSELEAANHLVATKYSTAAWVNRLP